MILTRRALPLGALALSAASVLTTAVAQTADQAAVALAIEALHKAMLDGDKVRLESLLAEQMSYGDLPDGKLETRAQFVDRIVSKKVTYKSIKITWFEPLAIAGTVAVVRHSFLAERESAGKDTSADIAVLQVWQKQDAGWKLIVWQAFGQA